MGKLTLGTGLAQVCNRPHSPNAVALPTPTQVSDAVIPKVIVSRYHSLGELRRHADKVSDSDNRVTTIDRSTECLPSGHLLLLISPHCGLARSQPRLVDTFDDSPSCFGRLLPSSYRFRPSYSLLYIIYSYTLTTWRATTSNGHRSGDSRMIAAAGPDQSLITRCFRNP